MQKLGSLEGKVTAFHVRLRPAPLGEAPEHYLARAQAEIEAALPGLRAVPVAERAGNNQLVLMAHAAAWGTSGIALLIGILRALGWKRWRVLVLIEMEAAVLGLTGGIVGIAVGWGSLRVLAALPQTASIVSPSFPSLLLAEALGIAVLAGLVAGLIPVWRGAHLSPMEALRHD